MALMGHESLESVQRYLHRQEVVAAVAAFVEG
jgi:hypothetical protein